MADGNGRYATKDRIGKGAGGNSGALSVTVMEDLCHSGAPSVSPNITCNPTLSHSRRWVKFKEQRRPPSGRPCWFGLSGFTTAPLTFLSCFALTSIPDSSVLLALFSPTLNLQDSSTFPDLQQGGICYVSVPTPGCLNCDRCSDCVCAKCRVSADKHKTC